ncbi:terminase small subunit [Laribacter hongkongensis]|uniref:terminase small subunit n=1 Tax=Laribacter hongkongensis TaxID=168471 RepID=UPI001EFCA398|nr:terminase small subunit [Laribacter hongkongensis]MCG9046600.1 terminase small subunit [Laribacter hongkongensis]
MALTGKKKAFADAVLAGKSNKDAAVAAGYSEKTASAAGSRLVKDSDVKAYLDKHLQAPEDSGTLPPDEGPKFDLGAALMHSDPMAFLRAAMNDAELDPKQRIEAAKAMLPYTHKRLGEGGKKETRQGEAEKVAGGRFSAGRPPLRVVGDK